MRFILLVSITLSVGLLAACGGGGGGGGFGPGPPPAPTGFRVFSCDPRDGEFYVPLDKVVRLTFSAPIFPATLDAHRFQLTERVSGLSVPGALTYESGDRVAVFTPSSPLRRNQRYEIAVLAGVRSVGAEDLANDFYSNFRTAVTDDPDPPDPTPTPKGSFRTVGDMIEGRSSHTATLLDDGDVLIAGGFATSTSLTVSAEVFDAEDEVFVGAAGNMTAGRAFHAAALLSDGRVLLAGGVTGAALTETALAETYSPATGMFAATGMTMRKARAFHTATLLADGRVLIAGGTVPGDGGAYSSRTAEIYVPATDTFVSLPDMAVYRAGHTATLLANGEVVLAGGNGTDIRVEVFDPVSDTFRTLAGSLKKARRGHTATLLLDGTVLLMGGGDRTGEIIEPWSGTIRWAPSYPLQDRKDHTASLLPSGHVFFTGGSYMAGLSLFFHRTTEQYDAASGAFSGSTPQMDVARARHRATTLAPGRILVTGGQNTDPTKPELVDAEIYELDD